ncbi:MAG: hypothetical protein AAFU34_15540 [Pseudomonadota bacterium]
MTDFTEFSSDELDDLPRAFSGEETGLGGVVVESFNSEAIRRNYWSMRQRRTSEIRRGMIEQLSTEVYNDPDGWKGSASDRSGANRVGQVEIEGLRDAALKQLFDLAGQMSLEDPGRFANVPLNLEDLDRRAEADAINQLSTELTDAEAALSNRNPTIAGGVAAFIGGGASMASDLEGLATLPFGAGAGSLGRAVLIEGALGGGAEALSVPAYQAQADALDIEAPNPALQIASGAVFGAALPVAGSALRTGGQAAGRAYKRLSNRDLLAKARDNADNLTSAERGAASAVARDESTRETDVTGNPVAHQQAVDRAEAQLIVDRPVSVVRPGQLPARSARSIVARITSAESGGVADASNANSSALGAGQFIDATWLQLIDRYRPDLKPARNRTEILELRKDPDLSAEMIEHYARENRARLGNAGVPTDDGAVYLAHFAGPDGAIRLLSAEPDTSIAGILGAEAMSANANIRFEGKKFADFTVGDIYAWSRSKMGIGVFSPDDYDVSADVLRFDLDSLKTDAETYQYKLGGDKKGVTDRLRNEREWDPGAALGVIVHERSDGQRYIADGHQRLGLAQRLTRQGEQGIELQGFLYREAEGWTPEMVRAIAALRNIRQESGTPLDAARIIRDYPELTRNIARTRTFMSQAQGLADLAPGPYMSAVNNVVPEHFASIVGRIAPGDEDMQSVMIEALRRIDPQNTTQAESVVRDVHRLGLEKRGDDAQASLFGEGFDLGESAIRERARVLDATARELRKDKLVFARLVREADRITKAGNRLDETTNAARQAEAESALQQLFILADKPGKLRDAIDTAAKAVRTGRSIDDAASDVLEALRSSVDDGGRRGDAAGALDGSDAPSTTAGLNELPAVGDAAASPDLFADLQSPGVISQLDGIEADLRARLDDGSIEDIEIPNGQGEDAPRLKLSEMLEDLGEEAEFLEQLNVCMPKRST